MGGNNMWKLKQRTRYTAAEPQDPGYIVCYGMNEKFLIHNIRRTEVTLRQQYGDTVGTHAHS
jgi:hypothetical protein